MGASNPYFRAAIETPGFLRASALRDEARAAQRALLPAPAPPSPLHTSDDLTIAVYLHQGESYVVDTLDFDEGVAFVHADEPGYTTYAREVTDISVTGQGERSTLGAVTLGLVPVAVTNQVIGYLRRTPAGEVIDFVELDMPARTLETVAAMYTITPEALQYNGIEWSRVPGALHAAEHAAIGLLPLIASCDRGDIGGLSIAIGPDTGLPTVFVYDGYPGGAGFAERGFRQAVSWLSATADAIESCECPHGCPSCVQSPKCGNGNDPLDKAGAVQVLRLVLAELVAPRQNAGL